MESHARSHQQATPKTTITHEKTREWMVVVGSLVLVTVTPFCNSNNRIGDKGPIRDRQGPTVAPALTPFLRLFLPLGAPLTSHTLRVTAEGSERGTVSSLRPTAPRRSLPSVVLSFHRYVKDEGTARPKDHRDAPTLLRPFPPPCHYPRLSLPQRFINIIIYIYNKGNHKDRKYSSLGFI